MNLRGITASCAAIAVAVVLPIAAAAPVHAGADPTVVSWTKTVINPTTSTCVPSVTSVRANPGSAITLHNNDCVAPLKFVVNKEFKGTAPVGGSLTITAPTTLGTFTIAPFPGAVDVTLIVTDTPISEPMAHDEFQQVGVPATGDCADVDPAVGHYPGYPIGGWSKSWAQWINGGAGGPVCTREVEQRPDGEIVLIG
jgi:hypothetical protein